MILTYASFLDQKDISIKETINNFVADNQYKKVNSFDCNGRTLRQYIDSWGEIILQDGSTQVRVKFDYKHDKLVISVNHTVKAFVEVFTNNNPLVSMVGHILKEHGITLCSFDLGSDGIIYPY